MLSISSNMRQFYMGQFFMGQCYMGYFYMGQFFSKANFPLLSPKLSQPHQNTYFSILEFAASLSLEQHVHWVCVFPSKLQSYPLGCMDCHSPFSALWSYLLHDLSLTSKSILTFAFYEGGIPDEIISYCIHQIFIYKTELSKYIVSGMFIIISHCDVGRWPLGKLFLGIWNTSQGYSMWAHSRVFIRSSEHIGQDSSCINH